jgi:tetratricopeptide (TPR) repeat protein
MSAIKSIAAATGFWLGVGSAIAAFPSTRATAIWLIQPEFKDSVSVWLNELTGDLLVELEDSESAAQSYREAQTAVHRLLKAQPKNAAHIEKIALLTIKIGDSNWRDDVVEIALKNYRMSMGLREQLVMTDPRGLYARRALSVSQDRVANTLRRMDDFTEAERLLKVSFDTRQQLIQEFPREQHLQEYLADSRRHFGSLKEAQGNVEAALGHYRAAVAIADDTPGQGSFTVNWRHHIAGVRSKITVLETRPQD